MFARQKLRFVAILAPLFMCGTSHGATPTRSISSAQAHLDRALVLANAYNWADAEQEFEKSERLFVAARDSKGSYAAHLGKMRSTLHHDISLPKMILQLEDDLDSLPFLQSDLRLRMFCLRVKGDFDSESDHAAMSRDWEQVRALAKRVGDHQWENRALAELGIAAYYNGDLAAARQRVGMALMAAHAMGDKPGEMMTLAILASGLTFAKLYDQAIPYADQSIAIANANPEIGYPQVAYQAKLTALIGKGDLASGERLAEDMLTYARRRGGKALEATALGQVGQIAHLRGDQTRAIEYLNESIRIATAGGFLNTLGEANQMLANIYLDLNQFSKAEWSTRKAAESAQGRGDFVSLLNRLMLLGRLQLSQRKYLEADQTFSRAGAFVDSTVGRSQTVVDKTAFISSASEIYRMHFGLLAEHFRDVDRAYKIIEQVRGRIIADLLASGSSANQGATQAERRAARVRLELTGVRTTAEVRRIRHHLFVMEQSRWITPDVSILKRRSGANIDLHEFQKAIPPATAVLEYVTANPRSYCLVITQRTARIATLDSGTAIDRAVASYLTAIKAQQSAADAGRALFSTLIQPIHEAAESAHLVIVRDGQLNLLPFDALMDASGRYVVESKVVTYAGSASSFDLLRLAERRRSAAGALLGVGDVPYTSSDMQRIAIPSQRGSLSNLPESKNELLFASSVVPNPGNVLLLGTGATESAFKHEPLRRYGVLHLAVHAIANTSQPEESALVLLSDPAAGEDGLLHASEIVQLKLNADLVVLSACDTAVGPIGGEEGIATLSRAFLLAGAKTVLSTLWPIDDLSTLVLMRQFYTHLASRLPADRALAQAKRDMITKFGRNASPYGWAAFTLEGAGDQTIL